MGNSRTRTRGLSLVEMLIGVSLLMFIMSSAMLWFHNFSHGTARMSLNTHVDESLRMAAEQLRFQAAYNFDQMPSSGEFPGPYYPAIKTTYTINAVDAATRTRRVQLVATYF